MEEMAESTVICNTLPDDPALGPQSGTTNCFHYPDAIDDLMIPYDDTKLVFSWAVLIMTMLLTVGATGIMISRLKAS